VTSFSLMQVLLILVSGGSGNDLLDYLPSDAYWRAKGVEVTAERLVEELRADAPADTAKLVADLGAEEFAVRQEATRKLQALGRAAAPALEEAAKSDDPEVRARAREILKTLSGGTQAKAVRRLMAIRTLGELKKPEALPALEALLKSQELFVADYARQAIAAIQGTPHERASAPDKALWSDLCLLPAGCGLVAQMAMPGGRPLAFEQLLKDAGSMLPPGQDPSQILDQLARALLTVAERTGNIRVEGVTVGVSEEVDERQGFGAVVVRGLYDAQAARAALEQMQAKPSEVDGIAVFTPDSEVRLIPCSNERFILAFGAKAELIPVGHFVRALRRKADTPSLDARMQELIKAADSSAGAWGVARMSDSYRQVPLFAPFDTVTLTSRKQEKGVLALSLVARGKDAEAVKRAVAEFEAGLAKARQEIARETARMAAPKPITAFLESITVRTEGAAVTVSARLQGSSAVLMMPFLFFAGVRSSPAPQPQPGPAGERPGPDDF